MKTTNAAIRIGVYAVISLVGVVHASGQSKEKSGYESFRLVRTRNIFDPNRVAVRTEAPRERGPSSTSRSRSLSLTGTMVTDGKILAFFGGSRGDGKVLTVGEKISDFTIKSITPVQVELDKEGKLTTLAVGRQLAVDPNGVGEESVTVEGPATPEAAPPAKTESAPAPAPAGSGDKNEILRRMMERRQQQMSK